MKIRYKSLKFKIRYVIKQYQLTIPSKERKLIRDEDIILFDKNPIKIDEYVNKEKAFQELDLLVPTEEVVGNNRIFKTFALIKVVGLDSGTNYFNGDYYTRNS